jgi:hypothetical protein
MSLETLATVVAVWFFGSIPVALFVGRCLRVLSVADAAPALARHSEWEMPRAA